MRKRNNARHIGQGPSTSAKSHHHRGQSRSPEPPRHELIIPGLTHEQWSLLLDRRCRNAAIGLALKIPNRGVGYDAMLHTAQEALVAAVRAYDASCGVPFIRYARVRMRAAMYRRAQERRVPERLQRWRQDLIWIVVLAERGE